MQLSRSDLKDKLERFYFTFGSGTAYKDVYVEIHAPDANEAREVMYDTHGDKWAFVYYEKDFGQQIKDYKLECLSVIKPKDPHLNYRIAFEQSYFDEDGDPIDNSLDVDGDEPSDHPKAGA